MEGYLSFQRVADLQFTEFNVEPWRQNVGDRRDGECTDEGENFAKTRNTQRDEDDQACHQRSEDDSSKVECCRDEV